MKSCVPDKTLDLPGFKFQKLSHVADRPLRPTHFGRTQAILSMIIPTQPSLKDQVHRLQVVSATFQQRLAYLDRVPTHLGNVQGVFNAKPSRLESTQVKATSNRPGLPTQQYTLPKSSRPAQIHTYQYALLKSSRLTSTHPS